MQKGSELAIITIVIPSEEEEARFITSRGSTLIDTNEESEDVFSTISLLGNPGM